MATNIKYSTRAAVRLELTVGASKTSGAVEYLNDMPVLLLEDSDSANKATVELLGVDTVVELPVTGADSSGNSAVAVGQKIFKDGAAYNKDSLNGGWIGYALGAVNSAATATIQVALVGAVAETGLLGVTATADEINTLTGAVASADITVGTQAGDVINVAVQLLDAAGDDLATRGNVRFYLSDDANGDSVAATAASGGIAIGTDGLAIEVVDNKAGWLTSEADGDIDLNITEAGADTWYLVIVLPTGLLVVSDAITFS